MATRPLSEPAESLYAPYIEELQEFFLTSGLQCGSPVDVFAISERMEASQPFFEDLNSLVRSILLRHGGSMPYTALHQILAIAVGGPEMERAPQFYRQPLRRLLAYATGARRMPPAQPQQEGAELLPFRPPASAVEAPVPTAKPEPAAVEESEQAAPVDLTLKKPVQAASNLLPKPEQPRADRSSLSAALARMPQPPTVEVRLEPPELDRHEASEEPQQPEPPVRLPPINEVDLSSAEPAAAAIAEAAALPIPIAAEEPEHSIAPEPVAAPATAIEPPSVTSRFASLRSRIARTSRLSPSLRGAIPIATAAAVIALLLVVALHHFASVQHPLDSPPAATPTPAAATPAPAPAGTPVSTDPATASSSSAGSPSSGNSLGNADPPNAAAKTPAAAPATTARPHKHSRYTDDGYVAKPTYHSYINQPQPPTPQLTR